MLRAGLAQLALGLLFMCRPGRAEPATSAPYELDYRAPLGCPDPATFAADVAKRVHDASRAEGARLVLTIDEQGDGFVGTLVAYDRSGAQGSRRIEGKTCREVAEALAFFSGLVIELGGRLEAEEAPAPPPKVTPPPASAPATAKAPPVAPSAPARRLELSVVALGGARGAFAPSPRLTGELGADLAVQGGPWQPSARLIAFVGSSGLDSAAGSARLRFGGARLELCPWRIGNDVLALHTCIGSELGLVLARGEIAEEPRSKTTPWATLEATLRLQWFASRALFAELGGGPVLPLVRTHYFFAPDRSIYSVPALSARVALGIGLRFE